MDLKKKSFMQCVM